MMDDLDNGTTILVILFVAAVGGPVLWMALHGDDLAAFDAVRRGSPKRYQELVRGNRITMPMVALLAVAGLIVSPSLVAYPERGWPRAVATFAASSAALWISIRWLRWSHRARID